MRLERAHLMHPGTKPFELLQMVHLKTTVTSKKKFGELSSEDAPAQGASFYVEKIDRIKIEKVGPEMALLKPPLLFRCPCARPDYPIG